LCPRGLREQRRLPQADRHVDPIIRLLASEGDVYGNTAPPVSQPDDLSVCGTEDGRDCLLELAREGVLNPSTVVPPRVRGARQRRRFVLSFSRRRVVFPTRASMTEIIMKTRWNFLVLALSLVVLGIVAFSRGENDPPPKEDRFDQIIDRNAASMLQAGRNVFRFDTFGDEQFWGDTLMLHQAIEGKNFGGVGPGVNPKTALALGLKVDVGALPEKLIHQLKKGKVNLDDPAVTLNLLKLNAVVGLTGFFNPPAQQKSKGVLKSLGIQCALCHSTVNNSLTFGIGHRLDGWTNRDLNVGAIIASAPNLKPLADLLGTDVATVQKVLNSWGPGKFDAELLLDGKGFRPDGKPAATMIPNAFGLAGFNQHTWTGEWGSIPYWNALVANLEMGGVGVFFDPRLNDAKKFPIAAKAGFSNVRSAPDDDRITKQLGALQFYQLAIPSPKPRPGVDFDNDAALRGDKLFEGKAKCNNCHVEPLWTEPGWNLHTPEEIGIDNFQANRAPNGLQANGGTLPNGFYKTMNLAGLFVRENGLFMDPKNKGRFYHDGRFQTLLDVVNHYNTFFNLGLSEDEKKDLVEYLKSLISNGSAEVGG
jgi:hypothetical protein